MSGSASWQQAARHPSTHSTTLCGLIDMRSRSFLRAGGRTTRVTFSSCRNTTTRPSTTCHASTGTRHRISSEKSQSPSAARTTATEYQYGSTTSQQEGKTSDTSTRTNSHDLPTINPTHRIRYQDSCHSKSVKPTLVNYESTSRTIGLIEPAPKLIVCTVRNW